MKLRHMKKRNNIIPNFNLQFYVNISVKLNSDSIYMRCDLHPVSCMEENRKQMLGIVLSLNPLWEEFQSTPAFVMAFVLACEKVVDTD